MQKIVDALNALEALGRSDSRLWKLSVLRDGASNPVFRQILEATYNPFKIYHIKKLPARTLSTRLSLEDNLDRFLKLLFELQERRITGNLALGRVREVFSSMTEIEGRWYARILQKDLNVGIQARTINEVIPNLIPVFGIMLAQPFRAYPREFVLQPKLDGMRILGSTTTGLLYSRKGKGVEGFTELEEQLRRLPSGFFVDGEILVGGSGQTFNTLMTQAFRKGQSKQGQLFTFDLLDEQLSALVELPLSRRNSLLVDLLGAGDAPLIHSVETSSILTSDSLDRVEDYYNSCLARGFEGIMVKDWNAPYALKRSYDWQKIKPEATFDLRVIGVEEGKDDTKYQDQVGKLVCDFEGVEVRVGSGLTDEQRKLWYDNPELIVGKTIEVMAQETTTNKKGTTSLRFPRYKSIRTDK